MTLVHTSRTLRLVFIVCYLFVAIGATMWHVHDVDDYAGYDEHCASCYWTSHTPIAIVSPYSISFSLNATSLHSPVQATPSPHTTFIKRIGRSPPTYLSK